MSFTALLDTVTSSSERDSTRPPLDWLLAMLKQTMEETMASEAKPMQKANAIARLGNLYLKTYGAAGLTKENKALKRRLTELESSQAGAAHPTAPPPAAPVAVAANSPMLSTPPLIPSDTAAPLTLAIASGSPPAFDPTGGSPPTAEQISDASPGFPR
jgi:hypothetical protein